eukprot:4111577-Amphidinium_carterae.1
MVIFALDSGFTIPTWLPQGQGAQGEATEKQGGEAVHACKSKSCARSSQHATLHNPGMHLKSNQEPTQ